MKAVGAVTRGTTNPHRLRRVDRWLVATQGHRLRTAADPLVVDLGFELAGLRPVLVRAMNVLRQYQESEVPAAWSVLCGQLAPDGVMVEGTCDELGRVGSWVLLDRTGPLSLTLSTVDDPEPLAERLPKALIHHNVPGTRIHRFLDALGYAWRRTAALSTFGSRQRWAQTVQALRAEGWPVRDAGRRPRLGEVTVAWSAVQP